MTIALPSASEQRDGRFTALRETWYYFSENRGAVAGLVIFVLLVLTAIFAPLIAPHDPTMQYRDAFLTPPAWQEGGTWTFPLGTDAIGRDILSRLIFGARYSLLIGAIVVCIALSGGIILGLIAGYFRGWVDSAIMRVMDIILAFPSLLLALVLVTVIGPGLFNAMLAIALVLQPHFARLTRASVIAEKNREYVVAAKVAGAGHVRLMFSTILPNCLAPLIVQATLSFSSAILDAAALGFLGMGAQPPTPEWGTMLADAREFIQRAWWVVTIPGIAILITVLAINLIGDGMRDALDPEDETELKMEAGSLRKLATLAIAAAIAGALATSAMAQTKSQFDEEEEESGGASESPAPASGGGDLIFGTSFDLIMASLQRNGFATELTTDSTGDPLIQSTDKDKPFTVQFYGCTDGKDCTFVQFIKGWNMDDGITLAKIEEWNSSKVWGKAYRDEEKDPWLTMPVNLLGGVNVANFDDTVDWWRVIVNQFEEHIGW